jgi:tetratricopeptide (TPR) repeat protein
MLATSRAWFLFAFSFSLFGGSAWAQISAIEGDVKDPDGQPLKGVSILIERKDMKGTYKGAKTDKKGHYIYNGLPLGLYKVSVLIDNQVRDTVDNVKTQLGEPKVVDFDLKKTAQQAQDLQKAAETGTLTKEQERGLTKEQKDALEKRAKESAAAMAHNKALNEAFNAGKEAFLAKNYQLAVDSFSKAAEVDPKQSVVWGNLADAYVALAGTQTGADQQATFEKSLDAFQKAIELKPDDAAYHNNYALALAKSKKYPEAQAELGKAAQIDPASASKYFYNLGAVLVNTGHIEEAGAAFQKAIEADPNYADAQYQYGVYLISKATTAPDGKIIPPPGTKEAFQKYLALAPTGPNAEAAKGMLASLEGSVAVTYQNPDAKKTPPAKKK